MPDWYKKRLTPNELVLGNLFVTNDFLTVHEQKVVRNLLLTSLVVNHAVPLTDV